MQFSVLNHYLRVMSDSMEVGKQTMVVLFPEITKPGVSLNRPNVVVFKSLRMQ
jgi:hypothetical protein